MHFYSFFVLACVIGVISAPTPLLCSEQAHLLACRSRVILSLFKPLQTAVLSLRLHLYFAGSIEPSISVHYLGLHVFAFVEWQLQQLVNRIISVYIFCIKETIMRYWISLPADVPVLDN